MIKVTSVSSFSECFSTSIENPVIVTSNDRIVVMIQQISLELCIYFSDIKDIKVTHEGHILAIECNAMPEMQFMETVLSSTVSTNDRRGITELLETASWPAVIELMFSDNRLKKIQNDLRGTSLIVYCSIHLA